MAAQSDAIRNLDFQPRKGYVHLDARGRLTLGSVARDSDYSVLVNEKGQILLDPSFPSRRVRPGCGKIRRSALPWSGRSARQKLAISRISARSRSS